MDSICVRCFQTIAKVWHKAELPGFEHKHIRDPVNLARFDYANLFYKRFEESMER